jgi:hypothetical protein
MCIRARMARNCEADKKGGTAAVWKALSGFRWSGNNVCPVIDRLSRLPNRFGKRRLFIEALFHCPLS